MIILTALINSDYSERCSINKLYQSRNIFTITNRESLTIKHFSRLAKNYYFSRSKLSTTILLKNRQGQNCLNRIINCV